MLRAEVYFGGMRESLEFFPLYSDEMPKRVPLLGEGDGSSQAACPVGSEAIIHTRGYGTRRSISSPNSRPGLVTSLDMPTSNEDDRENRMINWRHDVGNCS